MSDAEEAHLLAVIDKLERMVRLTRSGAGGVAQLRGMFLGDIAELKAELQQRPRVRDFKQPASTKATP
jgi:hypothetical protein